MNQDKMSMTAGKKPEDLSEEIRHGEVNNRLRHDVSEGQADQRHDVSEENADQRHSENVTQHGSTRRVLWGVVGSLIGVIAIGVAYHFHALDKVTKSRDSLAVKYHNSERTTHGLREEVAVLEAEVVRLDQTIIALHNAADMEQHKNAQYYSHMKERSEGYVDHIMSLNAALEAKDDDIKAALELAERRKNQRDIKKKFMSIAFAVARDNPVELADAVENIGVPESLVEMKFYPLVVEIALGLGSMNILSHITTIEGWDKTITQTLAEKVLNPRTVPFQKFRELEVAYNQKAGRLADTVKGNVNRDRLIEELKGKVYDVKYLPYPAQQVMYYSAYHTVAENLRPKDLSQWIGKATPEEWIGYLRMAVARNSNNVYESIMEHDKVTSIPEVKAFIEETDVLANLLR